MEKHLVDLLPEFVRPLTHATIDDAVKFGFCRTGVRSFMKSESLGLETLVDLSLISDARARKLSRQSGYGYFIGDNNNSSYGRGCCNGDGYGCGHNYGYMKNDYDGYGYSGSHSYGVGTAAGSGCGYGNHNSYGSSDNQGSGKGDGTSDPMV